MRVKVQLAAWMLLLGAGACAGDHETPTVTSATTALQAPVAAPDSAVDRLKRLSDSAARISELKTRALAMEDSVEKAAIVSEIQAQLRIHGEAIGGYTFVSSSPPVEPKGMTAAQHARLLEKMRGYNMRDPGAADAWAAVKRQELGR